MKTMKLPKIDLKEVIMYVCARGNEEIEFFTKASDQTRNCMFAMSMMFRA